MHRVALALLFALPGAAPSHLNRFLASKRFEAKGVHDHPVNHVEALLDAAGVPRQSGSTTHFYNDAILDHFDSSVTSVPTTWSQRFYADDTFWGGEGYPVFLYIGGEGPQSAPSSRLFMHTLAQEHKALMLALEHRYYGESQPVENMSDENLQWLTSSQALADLARFISYIKGFDPDTKDTMSSPSLVLQASAANSKWVAFGGSYPGNLATWLKLKYPALVDGVVGSSAPVFAEYDFFQYSQVVGAALGYDFIGGSTNCANIVAQATVDLMQLVQGTSPMGTADGIPEALKPCSSMETDQDLAMYQSELFGNFQGTVQYNLMSFTPYVSDLCQVMEDSLTDGASALEAFAAAEALFYNQSAPFEDRCIASNFQEDYIDAYLANVSFSGKDCNLSCSSDRQWIYQSCNEFGYFQTTGDNAGDITSPFDSFTALTVQTGGQAVCEGAFGIQGYQGPRSNGMGLVANTEYGARHVDGINITMPNGNMDPWHALSVVNATDEFYESGSTQDVAASVVPVDIDGTAHCRDMYAPGVFESMGVPDSEPVQWAHAVIAQNVAMYIA